MNNLIYQIFEKTKSEDEKVSSNAVTDLCCILEMNTWHMSKDTKISRFGGLVSQAVIDIEIDEHDEVEIVKHLHTEIVNGNKFTSSMLFALGQASCKVGLRPLIDIIKQHLDFNENEFYHALISLERLLFWNESLSYEEKREIIARTNLMSIISRRIWLFQPISHSDLTGTSLRLLCSLILLLDGEYSS